MLLADAGITVSHYVRHIIEEHFDIEIAQTRTFKETQSYVQQHKNSIDIVIAATVHSDCDEFEVIDYLLDEHLPVIVFTSSIRQDIRKEINSRPVIDYVLKSSIHNFDNMLMLIEQILNPYTSSILIVQNSIEECNQVCQMLTPLKMNILKAKNCNQALELLKSHKDINVMLVDAKLDDAAGNELVAEVRKHYSIHELAIIGITSNNYHYQNIQFLKSGANDYLSKPLYKEELIHKVTVNLELIHRISTITETTNRDFMTGIYNRKYAYETGNVLHANAKRGTVKMAAAMIDIDHFKKVNDTYGHDVGDQVIIRLANELEGHFRSSDIVARLGGEEFCVIISNATDENVELVFERFRKKIEESEVEFTDEEGELHTLKFTVSIGVTMELNEDFDAMLKFADLKLYEAKNYGRNLVVL